MHYAAFGLILAITTLAAPIPSEAQEVEEACVKCEMQAASVRHGNRRHVHRWFLDRGVNPRIPGLCEGHQPGSNARLGGTGVWRHGSDTPLRC